MAVEIIERQELNRGNSLLSLSTAEIPPLDSDDNVELQINFSVKPPLFYSIADRINTEMEDRIIPKWQGIDRYVIVDEQNNSYSIRWKHGNPVSASVILLVSLILGTAVAIVIALWLINNVVTKVISEVGGGTTSFALTGGIIVAGLVATSLLIGQLRGGGG